MKTLLILLFPISLFAQNIFLGGSLDTSLMIVKVCKHGADWNHPIGYIAPSKNTLVYATAADGKIFMIYPINEFLGDTLQRMHTKTEYIALKTQTCNWCCAGDEVVEYPNRIRDTTNDYRGQKAAEKKLILNTPQNNSYYPVLIK